MDDYLSDEQIEYAVTCLIQLVEFRKLSQTQLHNVSGVSQGMISKVLTRAQQPTAEVLKRLFQALGLKLDDIIHDSEVIPPELLGYLATPLTGIVVDAARERELRRVVDSIRQLADSDDFVNPRFNLYWPGDHTHPVRNTDFTPQQVYLTDRSRSSTFDFIILFCASPSYGVGQENEIAAQAGMPGIRLIPEGTSRMIVGSFLRACDVRYRGSLDGEVLFDPVEFERALRTVRKTCFRHRALYRGTNGADFGRRVRSLIDDRCGNYPTFAEDLGVSFEHLQALMEEPFAVTNPSVRLLKRMSVLLCVSVGYLLGETMETDPVLTASNATWHSWIGSKPELDARTAVHLRTEWMEQHRKDWQQQRSLRSHRTAKSKEPMRERDWDELYLKRA
jgi:transcriptional regulator with XRE-family HTH domain